jgi:hypothetical protein
MRKAALHFLTFVLPGLLLSYGTGNTGDQPATDQDERTFITDFKILAMRARPWKRSTWNDTRRLQNLKALDLAHQAGIQILTIDMRMMPFTQEKVAILCLEHTLWISEPINGYLISCRMYLISS